MNIPTKEDWGEWEGDIDLESAHRVFFGKSNSQVQDAFYRCVIERADELKYMPSAPFRYYIIGYRDFINSGKFMLFDEADAASNFLDLVIYRLKKSPEDIIKIYNFLEDTINFVSENQEFYKSDPDIYGNFVDKKNEIDRLLKSRSER